MREVKDVGKAFWGTVALLGIITVYSCQVGIIDSNRSMQSQGCLAETAVVKVNFDSVESDTAAIGSNFHTQLAEIEKAVKETEVTHASLRSATFSVSPQASSMPTAAPQYEIHRIAVYEVSPAGDGVSLMAALAKKGYKADADLNMYRTVGPACVMQGVDKLKAKLK